jgi:hypothetical protein
MPNNNDSIIDRILNGELDDTSSTPDTENCIVPESEDADSFDSSTPEDDEDDGESDFEDPTDLDDDLPSEEYCDEYMKENNIENADLQVRNSLFKNLVSTPTPKETVKMNTPANDTDTNKPKNSTTPSAPDVKRGRGRPLKLTGDQADETVRLYNEGVGAKTIAQKWGFSVSCVLNCLKSRNVQIRGKGRRKGT